MSTQSTQINKLLGQARQYKWLLLAPIAVCTLLAVAFALLSSPKWSATQSIVVREELTGRQTVKPGRFDSLDQMKTVQETIHEICKSPTVLSEVLKQVGPESGSAGANWPSKLDVEEFQEVIRIAAPNGAEFGQTEILHLTVKDPSQARAVELVETMTEVLQTRYTELRREKAASMEKETNMATELHQKEVDAITRELQRVEESVGLDLVELRSLTNPIGGSGGLQSSLSNALAEQRGAAQELAMLTKQYETLGEAQQNPDQIISTSNELLVAQPSLKRLKDGLIDAQLNRASVMGTFTEVHPRAKVAIHAVEQVRQQLKDELSGTLKGLTTQMEVAQNRIAILNQYIGDLENRIKTLTLVRAKYENATEDLNRARTDLATSRTSLLEARSIREATESSSLIVAVDSPLTGSQPEGLGKAKTVLLGAVCGLAIAIGLFMFVTSPNLYIEKRKAFIEALLDRSETRGTKAGEVNSVDMRVVDRRVPQAEPQTEDADVHAVEIESAESVTANNPAPTTTASANKAMEIDRLIDELKEYEGLIDERLNKV